MSTQIQVEEDVRAVLAASTVTATNLILPEGGLPRELYIRVGRALDALGGFWDRKSGTHTFERDPREKIAAAIAGDAIDKTKQIFQQYFTPAGLAARVADLAHITRGTYVLEPSAGEGALAMAARALGARCHCIELDPFCANKLRAQGFVTSVGDFLEAKPHPIFDRICMNPPFSKSQDIRHVTHALEFLKPDGILVAIMSPTWEHSDLNPARVFRDAVAKYHGTSEKVPAGTFKESGTDVASVIIRLQMRST